MVHKQYYPFVFSVVTYRSVTDLEELLISLHENVQDSYKVIVVNNYYDDASEAAILEISRKYHCDFIHSENDGYGSGNNIAANYAFKNYSFDFFIVSNPDIIIKKLSMSDLLGVKGIIAPEIYAQRGRRQNPMAVIRFPLADSSIYYGLKRSKKILFYGGVILGKIPKKIFILWTNLINKKFYKTYMAHGSFVIFHKETICSLAPLYDEKMFLFAEESLLAWKAKRANIPTYYTKSVCVIHKEDGSMKFRSDINVHLSRSNIYFYENYIKRNRK